MHYGVSPAKKLVSMRLQECDVIRMRARTHKEVKEILITCFVCEEESR